MTTDRNDPRLREIETEGPRKGQQKDYLVLTEEERAKGFVRPVMRTYTHLKCGTETRMGQAIAETYARNPKFYGGTFCCFCQAHFPLVTSEGPQFLWPDRTPVGSSAEEAEAILAERQRQENERTVGDGI